MIWKYSGGDSNCFSFDFVMEFFSRFQRFELGYMNMNMKRDRKMLQNIKCQPAPKS